MLLRTCPSAILPGATDEKRSNGRGSSLQSFFPGQDHPVEASTELSACLAAGYLVRSLTFTLAWYYMECLGG